mmetsp:Transcript_25476/g.82089  ORF Transcript_25476/g.82089 Transcript_25476/m.82089 type:complete len:283 (+) Transcript_25476:209-1057(+)
MRRRTQVLRLGHHRIRGSGRTLHLARAPLCARHLRRKTSSRGLHPARTARRPAAGPSAQNPMLLAPWRRSRPDTELARQPECPLGNRSRTRARRALRSDPGIWPAYTRRFPARQVSNQQMGPADGCHGGLALAEMRTRPTMPAHLQLPLEQRQRRLQATLATAWIHKCSMPCWTRCASWTGSRTAPRGAMRFASVRPMRCAWPCPCTQRRWAAWRTAQGPRWGPRAARWAWWLARILHCRATLDSMCWQRWRRRERGELAAQAQAQAQGQVPAQAQEQEEQG